MLARSERWSKLKAWGLKIQKKHAFKKRTMAVGRKLVVIMYRMIVDKTDVHMKLKLKNLKSCNEEIF